MVDIEQCRCYTKQLIKVNSFFSMSTGRHSSVVWSIYSNFHIQFMSEGEKSRIRIRIGF